MAPFNAAVNPFQSKRSPSGVNPEYRLSFRLPASSCWLNTARPAESGPRSVMPISLGTIHAPSRRLVEPLHALELEEFIGDGTECIADQPVTFERVERMFEVLRQDANAM